MGFVVLFFVMHSNSRYPFDIFRIGKKNISLIANLQGIKNVGRGDYTLPISYPNAYILMASYNKGKNFEAEKSSVSAYPINNSSVNVWCNSIDYTSIFQILTVGW